MKSFLPSWLGCFAALLLPAGLHAGLAYPDPAGGWSYIYNANTGEDVFGGGSSTEALIGIAIGVIEAGMCKTVVIFRSMNGYSQVRIGGTGVRSAIPVTGDMLHGRAYGWHQLNDKTPERGVMD